MAKPIRLAVAGFGASGKAHAAAARDGGFALAAVADLIPDRLAAAKAAGALATVEDATALIADPSVDAIAVCLPTHLHLPLATAALKAGKHVLIELPPTPTSKDAKALARVAEKADRVLMYAAHRRFGGAEQSARQAIEKGYVGPVYHARLSALRTRGVPQGTGWYHERNKSGGGAVVDLALPLIDLLLYLTAPAKVASVFALAHHKLTGLDVEESASILLKFDNRASAEISVAWALNQPASQAGTVFRLAGEHGAVDVYTPQGPTVYRAFDAKGQAKATPLKQPKVVGHAAMLRQFRSAIVGESKASPGPGDGVTLMTLAEAVYKSVAAGRSVEVNV